jgi:membrane associated rhomboid family serine protease
MDRKGKFHPCASAEALGAAIREDRNSTLTLVWAPGHSRLLLPEELEGMGDSLRAVRARWAQDDLDDASHRLRLFSLIIAALSGYTLYQAFTQLSRLAAQSGTTLDSGERLILSVKAALASQTIGLSLLGFVILAFIPWYQARKRKRELGMWTEAGIAEAAPTIRFETWLERQNAPLTRVFLILMILVALTQVFHSAGSHHLDTLFGLLGTWDGAAAAGLIKERYFQGEWWRLLTAPFLHGNVVHFIMNAAALIYLGKRLEVFARWPHLPLVFLFAACAGGEASARFVTAPSVGASGGLMGWLGFLLVFETLHKRLVPRRARRRLLAGVALTALIGLIGYRYIDNAAHAGGLLAGMLYAAIVFPSSSSPERPNSNLADRIAGSLAFGTLALAAWFAGYQIMAAS